MKEIINVGEVNRCLTDWRVWDAVQETSSKRSGQRERPWG